jgi:hypothetical protein
MSEKVLREVQPENQRIAFSCEFANLLILWWT